MRVSLVIVVSALVLAPPGLGAAQPYDADRARLEAEQRNLQAQQELQAEIARQNALAAQREAYAARDQMRADAAVRGLEAARRPPAGSPLGAPSPGAAALDAQLRADNARLDALTARLLAESNARVRAASPN